MVEADYRAGIVLAEAQGGPMQVPEVEGEQNEVGAEQR